MAAAPTTNTAGNPFLTRAYALSVDNPEDCRKLYDEWADTYQSDVTGPDQDYVAPVLAVQALVAANANLQGSVLDAGCGTGLVGAALYQAGAKKVDGNDLSSGMLKIAEKLKVYSSLEEVDLNQKMRDVKNDTYDVVTCIGTLTHGHVGPVPALAEFVRIVNKGGVVVATVLDDIWSTGGFKTEVERLKQDRKVQVVSTESVDYRRGAQVKARMLVLKKI